MDKHLNPSEIKLQNLLEAKAFNELSASEKDFVLQHMSKQDYELQRNVILESSYLYENEETAVAPPLVIPKESKAFWFKSLPIYHTGIAVAATVLLMWFVKFPQQETIKTETKVEYVSQVDTLVQTEYVYDTVFEVIEKPVIVEKTTYVKVEVPAADIQSTASNDEPKRMLNPSGPYPIPTMGIDETSSSSSFTNDETAVLVQDIILSD
jgi:hypothetical protein